MNLGFLDFSTLEKREWACREEVRLNRRLAPDVYLDVVPLCDTPEAPFLCGDGAVLEWAVKMQAFESDATLDSAAMLAPAQIDAIADRIALFHGEIAQACNDRAFGSSEQIHAATQQNFSQIRALNLPPSTTQLIDGLETWSKREGQRLAPHFTHRQMHGFVRECHGDLHLGNIAWTKQAPLIFDGIEFSPSLRFIDVINEVAFLMMDLHHRAQPGLAWRFLNRYLEQTGDYSGLAALPYYLTYRAMVRAKVAAIRAQQSGETTDLANCEAYLHLATTFALPSPPTRPVLLLMHGVSGSGKSFIAQELLEDLGAIRLRADVERKRLFGLPALGSSRDIPGGIYTQDASERTRATLHQTAESLLQSRFQVIVDATFLAPNWRTPFAKLAENQACSWLLLSPLVNETELRQRINVRLASGNDASEANISVLESQITHQTPLTDEEIRHTLYLPANWSRQQRLSTLQNRLNKPLIP